MTGFLELPNFISNPENRFVKLCASEKPEIIREALEDGANPNAIWTGRQPKHSDHTSLGIARGESALSACVRNNPYPESILPLLNAGADINAVGATKMTPLMHALEKNRTEMVSLLLQRGAVVNVATQDGLSALHIAAQGSPASIPDLIAAGADMYAVTQEGETTLHLAAANNHTAAVKALLDAGFSPNIADSNGNTPLHKVGSFPDMVTLLLKSGADVNQENKEKLTPFEMGCSPASLQIFLTAGARLLEQKSQGTILRARGFASESSASNTRFFKGNNAALLPTTEFAVVTPLQKAVLLLVTLETPEKADLTTALHYSEKLFFTDTDTNTPLTFIPYYIETEYGLTIYGRSGQNGCSARVYTSQAEKISWEMGIQAIDNTIKSISGSNDFTGGAMTGSSQNKHLKTQPQLPSKYGERVCFVDPDQPIPLTGYPYFIRTRDGYGIAGLTGEDGCSAEIFSPHPEAGPFTIYGGADAQRMNIKGDADYTFP